MTKSDRFKFQFSNTTAQKAEAALNLAEAQQLLQKRALGDLRDPEAEAALNLAEAQQLLQKRALGDLRDPEPSSETTEAGQCFRNVTRILAGRKGK